MKSGERGRRQDHAAKAQHVENPPKSDRATTRDGRVPRRGVRWILPGRAFYIICPDYQLVTKLTLVCKREKRHHAVMRPLGWPPALVAA
ncbi:hypothetical protein SUS17_911 [Sphingomonas sp. S17]|nr:hypothetical protein SUS17_911 [Sphingomonas sp. S17]